MATMGQETADEGKWREWKFQKEVNAGVPKGERFLGKNSLQTVREKKCR